MENSRLIELREKIKKCSEFEMKEIFKLLSGLNHTQNKNGIFIDMKQLDQNMVEKIENLLEYFQTNNDNEKERQNLLNEIKLNVSST